MPFLYQIIPVCLRWRISAVPVLLFACTLIGLGCNSSGHSGSAVIGVSSQALSGTDVARVTVTITAPDMTDPMIQDLTLSNGEWQGVIGKIPAGTDRVFSADAFDAADILIYSGQATGVTIAPGGSTLVYITLQEENPAGPFDNSVPIIDALIASPVQVAPGEVVNLTVLAHDPDGDLLSYAWSAPDGLFDVPAAATTAWTAPAAEGPVEITALVTDEKAATRTLSIVIDVDHSHSTGTAEVHAIFNAWPQVSSLTATPSQLDVGQTATLALTVSDGDGHQLSFDWSDSGGDCAGTFSVAQAQSPTWRAPNAIPAAQACTLSVAISDNHGGTTSAALTVPIGPDPQSNLAPVILNGFQSSAAVAPAGSVILRIMANDPEGEVLTFGWSAITGTLGTPTTGANNSEVIWTAPTSGCDHSITVHVSDPAGSTTTSDFSVGTCSSCQNGVAEAGEVCDGSDLSGETCSSIGLGDGLLACNSICGFDQSGCSLISELCDNGLDDDGDGFEDCVDPDCSTYPSCVVNCPVGTVDVNGDKTRCIARVAQIVAGSSSTWALTETGSLAGWSGQDWNSEISGPNATTGSFGDLQGSGGQVCAVRSTGSLQCWGSNYYGQVSGPNSATGGYKSVATSGGSVCAVTNQGGLQCWGYDVYGHGTTATAASGNYQMVATSDTHTCALTVAGSLECFGSQYDGKVALPNESAGTYEQVTSDHSHTCALSDTGEIECWGSDSFSEATGANAATGSYAQIASGRYHICAVTTGGFLECWGQDSDGQVSGPNGAGGGFVSISTGDNHTCAVTSDGAPRCWGPDAEFVAYPNRAWARYQDLAVAKNHTCALAASGEILCFGLSVSYFDPSTVTNIHIDVTAGDASVCALTEGNDLACWGSDYSGSVSGPNSATGSYQAVSLSRRHTCALTWGGELECWGVDFDGQVSGPNGAAGYFSQVSAGESHTCALSVNGSLECWGWNPNNLVSAANASTETYSQVSAGYRQTCAIVAATGDIQCWGWDLDGEVSRPDSALGSFLQVDGGRNHTCALRSDRRLVCWGNDSQGQVSGPSADTGYYRAVKAGDDTTCALTRGGGVRCWGNPATQQVRISNLTTVLDVTP